MDRQALIKSLLDEYARKQVKDQAEAQKRLDEAVSLDPVIDALRSNAYAIASKALNEGFSSGTADWSSISEKMRRAGSENNLEIRRRLRGLNLPEDYLDIRYECDICKDTGYIPDTYPSKFCECFERRLKQAMFEDGSMAGLDQENFDSYDETLVQKANPETAASLLGARDYCVKYAYEYPDNARPNLVLSGPGGVGKTFLLNCVFEKILERGHTGVRLTAYRLFEIMRKKHFGAADDSDKFDEIIDSPLLVIDDLGTEPMLKNITVEYLFTLLNERNAANRHTLVATNLSHNGIQERYGERVASRLFDNGRNMLIIMKGTDLRKERG